MKSNEFVAQRRNPRAFAVVVVLAVTFVGIGLAGVLRKASGRQHGETAATAGAPEIAVEAPPPPAEQPPTDNPSIPQDPRLGGHWRTDDAALEEMGAAMRADMVKVAAALAKAGASAQAPDPDRLAAEATKRMAGMQAVFTRDQILISNGAESKAISYRILEKTYDTIVIEMPENGAFAQGSMARIQFEGPERLRLSMSSGQGTLLVMRREKAGT
jgi:hypothetical protein